MERTENIFAANFSAIVSFHPFPDEIGLPFPINSHPAWKYTIVPVFVILLIQGSRLRKVIVSYMMSAEANLGPINVLIWLDQLNGLNLLFTIVGAIVMLQRGHLILPIFFPCTNKLTAVSLNCIALLLHKE